MTACMGRVRINYAYNDWSTCPDFRNISATPILLRVSGSDSYAWLFLLDTETGPQWPRTLLLLLLFGFLLLSDFRWTVPSPNPQPWEDSCNRDNGTSHNVRISIVQPINQSIYSFNKQYNTIQYNIRLLHRSQTATTSNMKQMNTKYNSRIT